MPDATGFLSSALALGTLLLVAAVVTAARPRVDREVTTSRRFAIVVGLAILAQCTHFVEELVSGFNVRYPGEFGLPPIPGGLFVAFNVSWVLIWAAATVAMRRGAVLAPWPLWFLALASVVNLVAHPLLALRSGGYFPGLVSAPMCGVTGALLLRELLRATGSRR